MVLAGFLLAGCGRQGKGLQMGTEPNGPDHPVPTQQEAYEYAVKYLRTHEPTSDTASKRYNFVRRIKEFGPAARKDLDLLKKIADSEREDAKTRQAAREAVEAIEA